MLHPDTREASAGNAFAQGSSRRSVVAVVRTSPETVLSDFGRAMRLAGYRESVDPRRDTCLKINISWHKFYPACSTTPWQLEGVVRTLKEDGFDLSRVYATHNKTVVVDDRVGEIGNKQKPVADRYGLPPMHLNDPDVEWFVYEPRTPMLVLDKVYPKGIEIPRFLVGKNIIHLPTMKTHVFTTMTGAMKNAFGGLLHTKRHWTHSVIHETLVDLLAIQKEIHPGIFAVMDGTTAGDGPGPRAMRWHIKNLILASADQVAIDAVSAKLMGFDPMKLDFIRLAHERGLGCGDPKEIELAGDDVSGVNFGFGGGENTFASHGQKMIYHGWLKPLETFLLRTPLVVWSYIASWLYHDVYWYPFVGRSRVKEFMGTEWGRLFRSY